MTSLSEAAPSPASTAPAARRLAGLASVPARKNVPVRRSTLSVNAASEVQRQSAPRMVRVRKLANRLSTVPLPSRYAWLAAPPPSARPAMAEPVRRISVPVPWGPM
ncbi:Uncharacterised protein [Bordetella pertussis]|nr:Uncharacterised protein [Bordetella pertussis]